MGAPLHGGELGQAAIEVGLVEGRGVQLLVEPGFQSHGADCLEIAGTRAEGEAVESVQNAFVALQLAGLIGSAMGGLIGGLIGLRGRCRRGLGKAEWSRGAERATQQDGKSASERFHL